MDSHAGWLQPCSSPRMARLPFHSVSFSSSVIGFSSNGMKRHCVPKFDNIKDDANLQLFKLEHNTRSQPYQILWVLAAE